MVESIACAAKCLATVCLSTAVFKFALHNFGANKLSTTFVTKSI